MEIRAVRQDELDEMIDLLCRVFRPDGHTRYGQYIRGDSSYRLDQTRVVVVAGRIVSTLRVWDRQIRIGSIVVHMGGIGGVGTHPQFRGQGYASALMRDTTEYLKASGYQIGVLFTEIPCQYYRRLGWSSLPLEGFRMTRRDTVELGLTNWQVLPFDETRDLEQAVTLYETYNRHQSGSIVRSRSHWDMAPSRLRDLMPILVARRGDTLGGFLNYRVAGQTVTILEVAHDRPDASALRALTRHLVETCAQHDIKTIRCGIPHRHPLVQLLVEATAGEVCLTGNDLMMLYAVNLSELFGQLLPEWQSRVDTYPKKLGPAAIRFEINDQACVVRLNDHGTLCVANDDSPAVDVPLKDPFLWQALFGESSWSQLAPTLRDLGMGEMPPPGSALLKVLFPAREVIFWGPDHF